MDSFKRKLRRAVEVQWIRFALSNVPTTLATFLLFLALRLMGFETFYATFINSMTAQSINFFWQKKYVFREHSQDLPTVGVQALKFFAFAMIFAVLEGSVLDEVQQRTGLGNIWTYIIGHTPIFAVRYGWYQYTFKPNGTPSSL